MERTPKLIIGVTIITVVAISLGVYIYLQSKEYIRGPVLTIEEPISGSRVLAPRVTVRGTAHSISYLTLNGRTIFTDEQGRFKEALLLPLGYSIITLEAKDRFGHSVEKRLELVYKPTEGTNDVQPTTNNEEVL